MRSKRKQRQALCANLNGVEVYAVCEKDGVFNLNGFGWLGAVKNWTVVTERKKKAMILKTISYK